MNDDENDGEKNIEKNMLNSERTLIDHHPSLFLTRLKEIVVNLSFSTSRELMRKPIGYGSNLRIKSAVQENSKR